MPEPLPDINLLPDLGQENSAQAIIFYIFFGLLLLSFVLLGYLYFSINSKLSDAEAKAAALTDEKNSLEIKKAKLSSEEGSAFEQAITFAEYYALPSSQLISQLNDLLPDEAFMSEYDYASSEVSLTNHFERLDHIAEYTSRLTHDDYIVDPKVESIETFSLKEEETEEQVLNNIIPRYEVTFTFSLDKEKIKEEAAESE